MHKSREKLGTLLARADEKEGRRFENAIVVPVPDSGRSAALGYARRSGFQYSEGLMKNRYVFRSFITPNQVERMNLVRMKLNPVRDEVEGKEVILIDDSIVRGTTMERIVTLLKWAGAAKVHVRSSCPPIRSPCFYGVDFPSREELTYCRKEAIANTHTEAVELIREEVGADSLSYLSIEDLIEALDIPREKMCLSCLTGKYWFNHAATEKLLQNGRI